MIEEVDSFWLPKFTSGWTTCPWTTSSCIVLVTAGGSRTSWEKTWFQHPDVWTSKVDFYNDSAVSLRCIGSVMS